MRNVLKPRYVQEYASKSERDFLNAPVNVLKGITATETKNLGQNHQITSVGQLIEQLPLPATWGITLSPAVVTALRCLFSPHFDPGPPCAWENVFRSAPLTHYTTHTSGRFRTSFGPVFYRGRLDGTAKVLVVGQDPSTDELIAHRNFVGDAGQKLQRLLNKLGLTRSYVMLNTFLFGITGQFNAEMEAIAQEPVILNYRNRLFDKVAAGNPLQAVLAFGNGAQFAVEHWPGLGALPYVKFVHPSAPDNITLPNWNARLATASAAITPEPGAIVDLTPYGANFTPADSVAIPRIDLPFGIPDWHGTNGTRSHRNGANEIIWDAV